MDGQLAVGFAFTDVEAKIAEMVRRIVAGFDPERVILFGSRARGTHRPDSDVDLMVVMPVTQPKRDQVVSIRVALSDIGVAKDVVVVTSDEFERYCDQNGTIVQPAAKDGRVLYARA